MKHSRRWVIALALLLALLTHGVALAHARLVRSNPEDGAVLSEAPRDIYLWFDEPVAAKFSAAQLLDASGQSAGKVSRRADPGDATLLIISVPPIPAGVYTLVWEVISSIDTHGTQGTVVFGVNRTVEGLARPAPTTAVAIPPLEVTLRASLYIALALAMGSWLTAGVILNPAAFNPDVHSQVEVARARSLGLGLVGALSAVAVGNATLVWQTASLGRGTVMDLVTARYGALWLAQQGLLLITSVALAAAQRGRGWGWLSAGTALSLVALVVALKSHAAGLADNTILAVTADTLHLLAAGAWMGSLLALILTLFPWLRSGESERSVALGGWRRFGGFAALGVGVLATTGLYNTARQVASLDAWISTAYGQALAVKIGLFLGVGLAGLINSALLHPRMAAVMASLLHHPAGWTPIHRQHLPRMLITEALLGLLVLGLTGWLTAAPPARGPEFAAPNPAAKPSSSLTQVVDDLTINLQIWPNQPGSNVITIGVFNTRRPPLADILRVMIRLTYADKDLGTQTLNAKPAGKDQYQINTSGLSLAGAWRARVVVRRSGLEDSVADFDWRVEPLAPSVSPRPVLISNQPLEPTLMWLAVGILIATVMAGLAFAAVRSSR
jgi:copper transport protein